MKGVHSFCLWLICFRKHFLLISKAYVDISNFLQIFNALTGAPYFSIHIGQRGLTTYFMSGSTLTVTFKTGVSEVWDLNNRRLMR